MPAFWKHLTVETRHNVLAVINTTTSNNPNPWCDKTFILKVAKYIDLHDVPKLRICHQVTKHDPSVIIGPCSAIDDNETSTSQSNANPTDATIIHHHSDTSIAPHPNTTAIVPYQPNTTAIIPHQNTTAIIPHQNTTLSLLITHHNVH